jgi:hypothetical protein
MGVIGRRAGVVLVSGRGPESWSKERSVNPRFESRLEGGRRRPTTGTSISVANRPSVEFRSSCVVGLGSSRSDSDSFSNGEVLIVSISIGKGDVSRPIGVHSGIGGVQGLGRMDQLG